jgi:PAS domain S-box-containing protein
MPAIISYIKPLRSLYEQTQDGILLLDDQGIFAFCNKAFEEITGLQSTEVKDETEKLVPKSEFKKILANLKSREKIFSKSTLKTKQGKHEIGFSLLESDGVVYGVMGLIKNISLSAREANYLIQKNPLIRALNSRTGIMFYVSDLQTGRFIFVSESIESMLGYKVQNFLDGGRLLAYSIVHPDDQQKTMLAHSEWIKSKENKKLLNEHVPHIIDFRMKDQAGNWHMLHTEINVLERDEQNRVRFILGTMQEVKPQNPKSPGSAKFKRDYIRFIDGKPYIKLEFLQQLQQEQQEKTGVSLEKTLKNNFNLSVREKEILRLVIEGLSSDEIAEKIFLSKHTVNVHRKQIMKKMGARNLVELVRESLKNGLV